MSSDLRGDLACDLVGDLEDLEGDPDLMFVVVVGRFSLLESGCSFLWSSCVLSVVCLISAVSSNSVNVEVVRFLSGDVTRLLVILLGDCIFFCYIY